MPIKTIPLFFLFIPASLTDSGKATCMRLPAKKLIYSVQTESFDPASSEALVHEYCKLIVKDMVKHQVLTSKEVLAKDGH